MILKPVPFEKLSVKIHNLWMNQWFLLTSGDFTKGIYNAMTIAWGSIGVMWNKPFVQVVVRPTRYTFEFMEQYDSFTLCAFPETYHKEMNYIGTHTGRSGDKIAATGLTPIAGTCVAAPVFAEAELVIECKKIYWQDMDPGHFLDNNIEKNYPMKDFHRVYFGQVKALLVKESKLPLYT